MLQTMKEESLLEVVGTSIWRIVCKPIEGSYDFRRHHVRKEEDRKRLKAKGIGKKRLKTAHIGYPDDAPVPIWGFEITRTDDTKIWLHPNAKNIKKAQREILFRLDTNALSQIPTHPKDRGVGDTAQWKSWTARN